MKKAKKEQRNKIEYEKPELINFSRNAAEGYCNPGTSADHSCYNGDFPGWYCGPGTDYTMG